ncbi:dethiobiotin synthase [[Pseudomonas] carboxydohydrogena]|uniref:ATP-dependent dethiobiotin synthetase BioD n=1 Tax=Afipia carboxydohydrogena TaxID=290 RepID=A0ABY8BL26_AFICR|nr:dethiobiotin synthase [[Pseudomonas] carboxydohydrogena]WEF50653.1 dethiobiotin synthase [[Pseudomonas] carboxydohydrogena]
MTTRLIVSGTDTDVGKTVFSAALADALGADYWKPIQAGHEDGTDARRVAELGGLTPDRILPERHVLNTPASPHHAARIDGLTIDERALLPPPPSARPLVIEGAGGLMVPVNDDTLFIDIFARWRLPLVLCARTALGTINHSLLSIEAVKRRDIPLIGIAFIGDEQAESERIICKLGGVRRLGRLPYLTPLTHDSLRRAFATSFNLADFAA